MPPSSNAVNIHADDFASPALIELLLMTVSRPVVEYVVDRVIDAVETSTSKHTKSPSLFGRQPLSRDNQKHVAFAAEVLARSRATMPTVLATLVYLDRVAPRLHIMCEDFAFERVFLGALIVARKFIHDCNYRCKHWASFTNLFGARDISRIEREFLEVLQFDLNFTEKDLLAHHDQLVIHAHSAPPLRAHTPTGRHYSHPTLATNPSHPHFTPERLLALSPSADSARSTVLSPVFSLGGGSSSDSDSDDPMSPPTPPPMTVIPTAHSLKRRSIFKIFQPSHHAPVF